MGARGVDLPLKGGLACSCPEADRWDHFAVLSRVAAVVTSRPTTLARLANEVNHRDVEPKMEQFGPAEAADGDREHEQNVVKLPRRRKCAVLVFQSPRRRCTQSCSARAA